MASTRFPGKPMVKINGIPMIQRVWQQAIDSKLGEVVVACSEKVVFDLITNLGGKATLTDPNLPSGTDRIYSALIKFSNNIDYDYVINLQGDMPNIKPEAISDLVKYMDNGKCDIGTLASNLESQEKLNNANIVKVAVKEKLENNNFLKADDFFRINTNTSYNLYHHIGIYAFTNKALIRYVGLKRSKLELERKLEQLRALENNMSIHVGYIKSSPLSVDTEEDLNEVKNLMKKK